MDPDKLRAPLSDTLDNVREFLSRYLVFPKESHAIAISLWAAHTWVFRSFDYTPYLYISSPVKRCGKSRLFDCLLLVSASPWEVVSLTEAVLFRKIEQDSPTIFIDEVDTIFKANGQDENKEGLRAILNAGFEHGAVVPRCVGPQFVLTGFRVFCPKALAGIKRLPDTVADRSIEIAMVRRARNEVVQKFRKREAEPIAKPIQAALEVWSQELSVVQQLHAARPKLPDALGDRAADICEPLLAIADMAGGAWPTMARVALVELCSEGVSEESAGVYSWARFVKFSPRRARTRSPPKIYLMRSSRAKTENRGQTGGRRKLKMETHVDPAATSLVC